MAGGPVSHTPVHKHTLYDGNGKLSEAEIKVGIKLEGKNKDGKGWNVSKPGISRLSTLQDASPTKQNNRMEAIETRQDKTDKKIDDMMAMMKELLNQNKGAK